MFATHAQLKLARIFGFRFGLSSFLALKDRGLWFDIVVFPKNWIPVSGVHPQEDAWNKRQNRHAKL